MILANRWRLVALAAALFLPGGRTSAQVPGGEIPVSGEAGPGLEGLDRTVLRAMEEHRIPGASLAVAKGGKLVLARGYGLADRAAREPVRPETIFGLASVSKSLTAATILKLVDDGRLGLDAKAFDFLKDVKPLPGDEVDPRIGAITIRQLLIHAGGWDRRKSGDPNGFSERVASRMNVPLPITPRQLTRYMLGQKLDFDPGTESQYSNFGYIVLGLVIEEVTHEPYEKAVRSIVLQPLKLDRVVLNHERGRGYRPGEAHRYGPRGVEDRQGGHPPITMASGGWLAEPAEMVRFLAALDGTIGRPFLSERMSREMTAPPAPPIEPRPNGTYPGLGWDQVLATPAGVSYQKNGGLLGVRAIIRHEASGVDWAFVCNGGAGAEEGAGNFLPQLTKAIEDEIAGVGRWPAIDLFRRAPEGAGR